LKLPSSFTCNATGVVVTGAEVRIVAEVCRRGGEVGGCAIKEAGVYKMGSDDLGKRWLTPLAVLADG
jgi:hypothetical protein